MNRPIVLALVAAVSLVRALPAQQDHGDFHPGPVTPFASAFLPVGHWAMDAARRLDALGLIDAGFGWGERSLTRREVGRALLEAVDRAPPDLAPLVWGYAERFGEEFPAVAAALAGAAAEGFRLGDGAGALGVEVLHGGARAGSYDNGEDWTGPLAAPEVEDGAALGLMTGEFFPYLAVSIAPGRFGGEWDFQDTYAVAAWRGAGVWLGRRAPGYGPAVGGGIILNGVTAFDGGGFFLVDPVRPPWVLRHLGPVRFETFLSRVERSGGVRDPWVWAARGSINPHPRLGIGVNRGAVFGGEGNVGTTLRDLLYLLVGKHAGGATGTGEFENQLVSVDVRYRTPIEHAPAFLYIEWGFEDSAGSWKDVPGIVAGIEMPALPGLPEVGVGVERASFAASCCGNPPWYRHRRFASGWADQGKPFGHPLGGHGTEWLAHARADLLEARLRIAARAFLRDRGSENLYAPDREGESTGGRLEVEYRVTPRTELSLEVGTEKGEKDWRETRGFAGVRVRF